jgi:hypothetical protein
VEIVELRMGSENSVQPATPTVIPLKTKLEDGFDAPILTESHGSPTAAAEVPGLGLSTSRRP